MWFEPVYADERDQYGKKGQTFIAKCFGQDFYFLAPKYLQDIKSASFDSLSFFQVLSDVRNMRSICGFRILMFTPNIAVLNAADQRRLSSRLSMSMSLLVMYTKATSPSWL